jgi:hypothetical protein
MHLPALFVWERSVESWQRAEGSWQREPTRRHGDAVTRRENTVVSYWKGGK